MADLDDLPDISVITVVFDSDVDAPKIDLGTVPPQIAVVVFSKAIEALEALIPGPTIVYDDEVVYSEFILPDDEDLE